MLDNYILLEGMKFYAYHGVLDDERKIGGFFLIDLKLHLDFSVAIQSDQVEDTVDYAEIYSIVKDEMEVPSNLLEHVAGRIIRQIKHRFPNIAEVNIKLSKLNPPVGGEVAKASVVL